MAHLTKEDRLRIENMLNAGVSATECQEILGKVTPRSVGKSETSGINNFQ